MQVLGLEVQQHGCCPHIADSLELPRLGDARVHSLVALGVERRVAGVLRKRRVAKGFRRCEFTRKLFVSLQYLCVGDRS